jgi:nucleotide-binding universal stress UspA family protein
MFRKILVCLDGSSFSEQALRYASEEVTAASKKLVLLYVANTATMLPEPEQVAAGESKAKAYLNKKAQSLKDMGIDTECVAIVGEPGPSIVNYAEKNAIDLIAIATHSRSGINRMVFGSVAEYVVKNSKLPILLIRPK